MSKSAAKTSNGQIVKETKNKSSNRVISLPPSIMQMMRVYWIEQKEYRLSIGSQWKGSDWLFIQSTGEQMNLDTPCHTLKKIIKRYNETKPDLPLPLIPLHGLRHTAASLLISSNIDVRTVSGRLGHSDTSTTLDIYAHFMKQADEKASAILEDVLSRKNS